MRRSLYSFRLLLILPALVGATTLMPLSAHAQAVAAPFLLNFQGRLAKSNGTPVADGNYTVQFSLYNAVTGGTLLWQQTVNPTAVRSGTFAAALNVGTNFQNGATAATLFNGNLWLEIKVGTDVALTPRQQLVSVAYALKANSVPDNSITATKIADGAITAAKLATGVGFAPSGAAGGDLTGLYPNPQLATLTSSLYKVSGTLLSALQGGTAGVDAAQNTVTAQNQDEAWQSFTPTQNGNLTAIDLYIGTTTGVNKTIPLTIYSGEGTTGGVLRQVSIVVSPTMGFQNYTISPPVTLIGGQKYTYYVGRSTSLQFGYSSSNPYAGGTSDIGPPLDYAFRTYMNTGASGRVNVNGDFTTNGFLGISNNKVLELGFGVAGKEQNAGKIGYGTFSGDALDIVGAGTTFDNRKIKFWAEGVASFTGKVGIGTETPTARLSVFGGQLASTAGSTLPLTSLIGQTANAVYLNTFLLRSASGSDWTTAPIVIQRVTDVTNQAMLSFYGNNIGIGTAAPGATLDVNGTIRAIGSLASASLATGPISAGALSASSITSGPITSGPIASGAITAGGPVVHGNVVSLGNFGADGNIGTAVATVDVTSTILINQSTTFRSLTIPNPTNTTAGLMVRIVNIGSAKFQVQSAALIPPGRALSFLWTGSGWLPDTSSKRVLTGTVNIGNVGGGDPASLVVSGDFTLATSTQSRRLVHITMGWSISSSYAVVVSPFSIDGSINGLSDTASLNVPATGNAFVNAFDLYFNETFGGNQTLLAKIMVIEL